MPQATPKNWPRKIGTRRKRELAGKAGTQERGGGGGGARLAGGGPAPGVSRSFARGPRGRVVAAPRGRGARGRERALLRETALVLSMGVAAARRASVLAEPGDEALLWARR